MVKTPEEYFQEQDFYIPENEQGSELTQAEQAFLHKYVGLNGAEELGVNLSENEAIEVPDVEPLETSLKQLHELQMIFFHLCEEIFAIPIEAVQEVLQYTKPMCLPLTSKHVAGIVNLRGRITPLIRVDVLLCNNNSVDNMNEKLIIICQRKGMQFGMIINKIKNMYIIPQSAISWNVEHELGASVECVSGIIEYENKVYGIVSIDKIVNYVLQARGV